MTENGHSTAGAKTLARGITALQAVVDAPDGLSAQDVADLLEIHRTIAHRMLVTLAEAGLIAKGDDAKYRGAVGLGRLRSARYQNLKYLARPLVQDLAEKLGATVTLLVAEGDRAVALLACTPHDARFQFAFSEGDSHSIELAAGGHALRSIMSRFAEDASLDQIRADGYAMTFGEVEPGAWGLAAPLHLSDTSACINVISHREDVIRQAITPVREVAAEIEKRLNEED